MRHSRAAALPEVGVRRCPCCSSTGVIIAVVLVLAWREERTRIAVVLMLGMTAFLFAVPSWFQHYAALTAPALALAFGSAAQQVAAWLARKRPRLGVLGVRRSQSLLSRTRVR